MQDLVDAASVVASADDMADMKFSREMFAIMADSYPALGGVIALHLWPQFFDEYVCNELLKSWTFVKNLFPLMIDMEESGFNSLTFTVTYPESAELKFQAPNGLSNDVEFELIPSLDPLEVGDFDFSSFVSLESEEFVNIVTEYHMFDYVHVIVTSTRVIFSYAIMLETILTQEDGECLIGGITAPNHMEFIINLSPIEAFYSMAHRSKRVWLYKSMQTTKGVIIFPLGLYYRFVAYFYNPGE
ncbi:uncharacterized protein LOC111807724 [Cucurbita pepo subsp. pepo]|uniref:uncharacterized protein LOC111807724 n=1 Tax=Cucurbita pepo subsp. pepo TaxID=3664 RepID=UPI000C9D6D3E|nr:uncharacterized protein LOC111807724 [Cucurbita pepo subsp. pepo]